MRFVVRAVQAWIIIHLAWAAVTGAIVTLTTGHDWQLQQNLGFVAFTFRTNGIAGEAFFPWWMLVLTFFNRVLYLYAFYRLLRLFNGFARKQYFSQDTIGHMQAFTGLFTLFTVSRLGLENLFVLFVQPGIPEAASIRTNWSDLSDLAFPILFFIIARVLNEARRNREELDTYF